MTDQIHIHDLHLRTIIGISDEERRDWQEVLISITLDTDLHTAGHSDDINDETGHARQQIAQRLPATGMTPRPDVVLWTGQG